jgi:hypothetical protein
MDLTRAAGVIPIPVFYSMRKLTLEPSGAMRCGACLAQRGTGSDLHQRQ